MISLLDKTSSIIKSFSKTEGTCAQVLVETLSELGVKHIFGYPGATILSIYNELFKKQNIRHILVRHEQAAVHMAEGYARITGKAGVVLVTSGPGFTNTLTGIANAYADSTPLVVIAGDVASSNTTRKVFQKLDIISISKSCCKKSYLVTPNDDIRQIVNEAFAVANSGEKGPVVVAIPRNVLELKYKHKREKSIQQIKSFGVRDCDLKKVAELIKQAKSPLLLLGGGAIDAVDEIKTLVKNTTIPVTSTLMGIGIFPSDDDLYLGMVGINGSNLANHAIKNADLIIAAGVSFSDRTTCKNPNFTLNSKIISINMKKISNNFELEIISDAKMFIEGLSKIMSNFCIQNLTPWHNMINVIREENISKKTASMRLQSSKVLKTIYEYAKKFNPIVVTDVGQHQLLTAQFFNFNQPKKFITSGGLGTMGFGLPAAIGAQIANPENLVLNITGDGSFQMNLQELATCREHHIPIKIIIMNNSYLGMVRQLQEKIYNQRYQVEMINPDFTKIAEAYDLFAIRVSTYDELIPSLEKAFLHGGTAIIDIAIDLFEEI